MNILRNVNPLKTEVTLDTTSARLLYALIKLELIDDIGAIPKEEDVDSLYLAAVLALKGGHEGDCTGHSASCMKCYAERLLGIDTISGLSKDATIEIWDLFQSMAVPDSRIKDSDVISKLCGSISELLPENQRSSYVYPSDLKKLTPTDFPEYSKIMALQWICHYYAI